MLTRDVYTMVEKYISYYSKAYYRMQEIHRLIKYYWITNRTLQTWDILLFKWLISPLKKHIYRNTIISHKHMNFASISSDTIALQRHILFSSVIYNDKNSQLWNWPECLYIHTGLLRAYVRKRHFRRLFYLRTSFCSDFACVLFSIHLFDLLLNAT